MEATSILKKFNLNWESHVRSEDTDSDIPKNA